jgi:hypothetical protein
MSWRCGGKTSGELVENLLRASIVSPRSSSRRHCHRLLCPAAAAIASLAGVWAPPRTSGLTAAVPAPAQIKDARVAAAMKAVDRAAYCSSSPYVDSPQRIGFGATSARD